MALDRLLDLQCTCSSVFMFLFYFYLFIVIPMCGRQSWPALWSTFGRTIKWYLIDWLILSAAIVLFTSPWVMASDLYTVCTSHGQVAYTCTRLCRQAVCRGVCKCWEWASTPGAHCRASVIVPGLSEIAVWHTGWPKKVSHHQLKKIVLKIANKIRFFRKDKVWIKHNNTIRW